MKKPHIYSYRVTARIDEQLPLTVKDAMRMSGWNALGVYEMVGKVLREEALDAHTPTAANAGDQEPERMTIAQSREYLVKFMEKHFTDKTFHRYIRAERDGVNLATDFAWQMARALRMIERTPTATNAGGQTDKAAEALTALEERLALIYRLCCGTAPKQTVGELVAGMQKMPEWATVRAAVRPAAKGAGGQEC